MLTQSAGNEPAPIDWSAVSGKCSALIESSHTRARTAARKLWPFPNSIATDALAGVSLDRAGLIQTDTSLDSIPNRLFDRNASLQTKATSFRRRTYASCPASKYQQFLAPMTMTWSTNVMFHFEAFFYCIIFGLNPVIVCALAASNTKFTTPADKELRTSNRKRRAWQKV